MHKARLRQFLSCCGALIAMLCCVAAHAQSTALVTGIVRDEHQSPTDLVTVAIPGTGYSTVTAADGRYRIELPANESLRLYFQAPGAERIVRNLFLAPGETRTLDVQVNFRTRLLDSAVVRDNARRREPGAVYLDPAQSKLLASPVGGIEGMIKIFTGDRNELTSQYTVRGGNYDENLVYVNDFEIYRPFLVRSGQQEGLSFVNTDLTSGVNFSLGGFQAKYGDKMSSVLDVTYKRPVRFGGSVTASLLGAAAHVEGASENKKFTYLLGVRQKSNQYLLQSQPTKGVYNPSFTDFQGSVGYRFNKKWEMELIANYARNRFSFQPESQVSSFGLVNQAYQLRLFYSGNEIDQFDSRFGGISTTYRPNSKLSLKLLASGFQTNERETYDIGGEYLLGELETDPGKSNYGQIKTYLGTGIIQNYARNYLRIGVGTVAHRGSYAAKKHFVQWGADATRVGISDRLHEWERRDSAGFTQPYTNDSLTMQRYYNSGADFSYMRYTGFLQDNIRFRDSLDLTLSGGVRFNYSTLNGELVVSPRVQLSYRPKGKTDIVFKVAVGRYAQPPLYRELRDLNGNLNLDILAQKSWHYVAGADYNFRFGNRPLKLTGELYYKSYTDLVPYRYDNVRIRYFGNNNSVGYAVGGEIRFYGDLVKDAPSWLSIGLLKTEENILTTFKGVSGSDSTTVYPGYIPRPTDQRASFGLFLQDYLPGNKNFRAHLNLLYATGLPTGPPSNASRYSETIRLPDYKRVDLGISAVLIDAERKQRPAHSLFNSFKSVWVSLEVFNLLAIQNTLSYTWVQDQTSGKVYAVPNRLTARLLNVKLVFNF